MALAGGCCGDDVQSGDRFDRSGAVATPRLVLTAPMRGWVSALEDVPDPVFSGRMLGDGLAMDPVGGGLHAPCDGVIESLHPSLHAITLRTPMGIEILMHVGLETVALGGTGFRAHVQNGQVVRAGDMLIEFDLDLLSTRARSLMTPIVITASDGFRIERRVAEREVAVGDFLMELVSYETATHDARPSSGVQHTQEGLEITRAVVVPLHHGIHARPAARIADRARRLTADVFISSGHRSANAKSPIALMSLAIGRGARIELRAEGEGARHAVDALADLIESGMDEKGVDPEAVATAPADHPISDEPGVFRGVVASPGLAIGVAFPFRAKKISVIEQGQGIAQENAALTTALGQVRERILAASQRSDGPGRAILDAHRMFLDDPELLNASQTAIALGKSAGFAWKQAMGGHVKSLQALGDQRMAERVDDLIDLERQVLQVLAGDSDDRQLLPGGAVLIAEELLPSQFMALDTGRLVGLCLARGGPTSHVAILAASIGLPMLVAVGADVMSVAAGTAVILDADTGLMRIAPDADALASAQMDLLAVKQRREAAQSAAHEDCLTIDGTVIEVFANVGSIKDAEAAIANGAQGSGLLRTEFLFLDRQTPPDEDEQAAQYQAIASALVGRPLIVRTLDIGGDKAVPYLPIPVEENPALGLRGVRVSLWRPQLLQAQIRAILRVRPVGQCRIMVPMISSLDELRAIRTVVDQVKGELGIQSHVELGVMVETPAAAVTADILAGEADFLSIGTNDLTQYVLAMDRGNAEMAPRLDAMHPAVLRLIAQTCEGAARHDRWVGVCGGLASDLVAAPILVGLGVTELSCTAAVVPEMKALIRTLSRDACRDLASQCLRQTSPEAVRALARTI